MLLRILRRGQSILKSSLTGWLISEKTKTEFIKNLSKYLSSGKWEAMLPSLHSSPSASQADSCSYSADTYRKLTTCIVAKHNKSKCGIPLWRIKKGWILDNIFTISIHRSLHEALCEMTEVYLKRNLLCRLIFWLNPSITRGEKTNQYRQCRWQSWRVIQTLPFPVCEVIF